MPAAEHDIPTKIFLGNLSFDTDEKKLQDMFAKVGPIDQLLLMRDKESGTSRGFAFITYVNANDAKDAVSRYNESELDGKFIKVDMALKGIKQQTMAARGGTSGRGMDRGRGSFRGRGGPVGRGRGEGPPSFGPPGRGGGPPGRGGPSSRGGPPGRGGPVGRGGPPARGGLPSPRVTPYPARGGRPHGGPLPESQPARDDYPAQAAPRAGPPRSGKEPLLSAPPASAVSDYRARGYDRGYEREPEPRRDHAPRPVYDAEEPVEPRRRAYPEDEYGAAPASARPSRVSYGEADPYARERYPPAREEPAPRRAYPEREGYAARERDPYAPPARDSYSTAAASRPSYDYSLPASRETPAAQREYAPATARTASRYEEERGYERAPPREAAYGREYEREAAPSRSSAYADQYPRSQARAPDREYAGSSSAAPRYDPYSYAEARSARPAEKSPYGARDSYGSPSSAGGRGAYPAERASRPLDHNGGGVPPATRAPPPSRGYERY
ncbi:RNA-binding motif protein, X chromosome-like isoform X2 [Acanthaster planci]|uniref:RNA-binding motif protein, X chromosome-like isoform X2 n=1 Tax=Acanthaster planci TaxID=133434 RepID=A0A8B7YMQ6_ACAPL|nr:RNA-binding motif protein, X chromosome-like isoform X2 [Acanthaster planci]